MPQVGFEAFTPSHNYQVLTDEAARNMGAVYADIYARKKDNEFKDKVLKDFNNSIKTQYQYDNVNEGPGANTMAAMTKGHNSPVKFMGGLVGAASSLMGGSQGMGTLAGGIGGLFGGGGGNVAGNTMHMAMHARLNKKLEALGASAPEQVVDNPVQDNRDLMGTSTVQQNVPIEQNPNLMPFNEDTIKNM
jgi:hypothetical protein